MKSRIINEKNLSTSPELCNFAMCTINCIKFENCVKRTNIQIRNVVFIILYTSHDTIVIILIITNISS